MNLEIKHLAPYLPYGLKINHPLGVFTLLGLRDINMQMALFENRDDVLWGYLYEVKPILRPMSDLTQDELRSAGFDSHVDYLTHELQSPSTQDRLDHKGKKLWNVERAPYEMVAYLFEHHFDVFDLIPGGLAVDINTLKGGVNDEA